MRSSSALALVALCAAAPTVEAQQPTIRALDPGDGGVPRWGRPAGGVPGPAPVPLAQALPSEMINLSRVARIGATNPVEYAIYGASRHRFWLSRFTGGLPRGSVAAATWDSRLLLIVTEEFSLWYPRQAWSFAVFRPEHVTVDAEGRPSFPSDLLLQLPPTTLGSQMYSDPVQVGVDIDYFNFNGGVRPVDPSTGVSFHGVPAVVPDPAFTGAQNPVLTSMPGSGTQAVYHLQVYAQSNSATWSTLQLPGGPLTGWKPNDDGELGFLRVEVTVDNFGDPTASVSNVSVVAPWAGMLDTRGKALGGQMLPVKEPTATFDGRLVVCSPVDRLVYTYNSDPSNPNGWTPFRDLNHLHTDAQSGIPALEAYPLARERFRAPDGALVPQSAYVATTHSDTHAFKGAYPWLTPDGDAIVFTSVKPPANSLRAGLVYLGSQTDHRLYLIDSSLNPDRDSTGRLVSAGLSLSPGFWDVLRDTGAGLPMRPGAPNRSRIALVNISEANYGEIDLAPFRDPDVAAFFPMNEALRHHPGPTTDWHYDAHRWDHDPQSTIDVRRGRPAKLHGAKFPVEHHNPGYVSTPHTFNNNHLPPPDVDFNAGFVGNAIYFWPGTWVELPTDAELNGTGSFTLRCFFRPDSLPSSGTGQVDLVSIAGKHRLGVTLDRRVFGEVVLPGIGTVSLQSNAGIVAGAVWFHLALTYDLVSGVARLWVDGEELLASSPNPGAATASGAGQPLILGPASSSGSSLEPWLRLDEVGVDSVAREGSFLWDAAYRPPLSASGPAPTPALVARVPVGLDPNDIVLPLGSAPWSDALAELGEDLFLDPRLSVNDTLSCASCHMPDASFASDQQFDKGVAGTFLRRHTPTLINRAFSAGQFWDGHASSLEDQATRPIVAANELGFANVQALLNKLESMPGYAAEFALLFGGAPPFVTQPRVEAVLSAFQRSLLSGASDFDLGQLPTSGPFGNAVRGEQLFRGKARCSSCHSGPNFTDELFHNTGSDHGANEAGRWEVTGYALDHGAFKTPTVRDVMRRAGSLFHDGSHDIDEVLEFYRQGGVHQTLPGAPDGVVDPDMLPLDLTDADLGDLKAFLAALNGAPIVVANPPDAMEPNDLFYVGPMLAIGDVEQLDLTVRDVDFFLIVGPAQIEITFNNATGNLDLFAADATLQIVAQSISTTSGAERVAVGAGLHVVCVTSLVGATNTYTLAVTP